MAVKTQIPTSNIHDYDIMDTLNANGGKVSSWEGMFKAAANINPWSKHKPIQLADTFVQDFDSSKPHYKKDWWKGADGLCGFDLSSAKTSGFATLVGLYNNGTNGWNYVPVYGQGTPLRQNDFALYFPAAEPLVKEFSAPTEAFVSDRKKTAYITIPSYTLVNKQYALGWEDFPVLKDYYFGVLLYFKDSDWQRITSANTIGEGGLSVEFDPSKLTVNKYTIYPFISKNMYTSQAQSATGEDVIYTLPNIKSTTIVIKSSAITITVKATTNDSTRSITVSFDVANGSASDITFKNNWVKLRKQLKDFDDDLDQGEIQTLIADNLVAKANTTTTFTGTTFNNIDASLYANCRVWVSLNSGQYKSYKDIVNIDVGDKTSE